MRYCSEKIRFSGKFSRLCHRSLYAEKAFTLIETLTALAILALICSSVLMVIDRSMASAIDLTLRMQAFETARENMETLLLSDSVTQKIEYGVSERYIGIEWETSVEGFHEPLTDRMWLQAVCSAQYIDNNGEEQQVELVHWLTGLTKDQMRSLIDDEIAKKLFKTAEDAAEYAGVDEETIQQWVDDGMPLTDDGRFTKDWVDLYKDNDGNPSEEDKEKLKKEIDERASVGRGKRKPDGPELKPGDPDKPNDPDEPDEPDEPEWEPTCESLPPNPTIPDFIWFIQNCLGR